MRRKDGDVTAQGVKTNEAQSRDRAYRGKKVRGGYVHGARLHIFDQQPANAPPISAAFSGKGFLPNLHAQHAPTTLYEASATTLENEGVHGRESMLPPPGTKGPKMQLGQRPDEGSGGAGSFATISARYAKTNG